MERHGTHDIMKILSFEVAGSEAAERLRESEMLRSLKKQNLALDHLRRALDSEDEIDETSSMAREQAEAGLIF